MLKAQLIALLGLAGSDGSQGQLDGVARTEVDPRESPRSKPFYGSNDHSFGIEKEHIYRKFHEEHVNGIAWRNDERGTRVQTVAI